MDKAKQYAKGIGSLAVTVAVAWIAAASDDVVTAAEWWTIAGALLSTIAVVGIPNTLEHPALKTGAQAAGVVVAGIGAALTAGGQVDQVLLVLLAVQAAGVLGVEVIPNRGDAYDRARARHLA